MGEENIETPRPRSPERRGQHCIKHAKVTKELIDLCHKASKKVDLGLNEWMCDALRREAERVLQLPVIPDVRESLYDVAQRLDRLEQQIVPGDKKDGSSGSLIGRFFGPKNG